MSKKVKVKDDLPAYAWSVTVVGITNKAQSVDAMSFSNPIDLALIRAGRDELILQAKKDTRVKTILVTYDGFTQREMNIMEGARKEFCRRHDAYTELHPDDRALEPATTRYQQPNLEKNIPYWNRTLEDWDCVHLYERLRDLHARHRDPELVWIHEKDNHRFVPKKPGERGKDRWIDN